MEGLKNGFKRKRRAGLWDEDVIACYHCLLSFCLLGDVVGLWAPSYLFACFFTLDRILMEESPLDTPNYGQSSVGKGRFHGA